MKLYVKEKFDAAHFLPNHPSCGYIHGHTWVVEVELEGIRRGRMLIDFKEVKKILKYYDHDFINKPQKGQQALEDPTAENLADFFAGELLSKLGIEKVKVKVWESDKACAIVEKR